MSEYEFTNGQPYTALAGELLSTALALALQVRARRPEVATIPGPLHATVDAASGALLIGLTQADGRVVIIERIVIDPAQPQAFGASALPTRGRAPAPHAATTH